MRLLRYLITCIAATIFAVPQAHTAVYWEFQLAGFGGYNVKHYGERIVHAGTGINLFIPVSRRFPLLIETGLHYRIESYQFEKTFIKTRYYEDGEKSVTKTHVRGHGNYKHGLQIPLKLNYEYGLNDNTSLRFGLGAFARYNIANGLGANYVCEPEQIYHQWNEWEWKTKRFDGVPISVGINPSVVLSHRCVSFGVSYEGTLYNPLHNRFNHAFMFTFGLKFRSHVWKYIGMGVGAAAMVAGGVAGAYYSAKGGNQAQDITTSSTDNSSTDKSTSNERTGDSSKNNISEHQSFLSDSRTYANYDSMLANHFAGNKPATAKEVKSWQDSMKKIREKWGKRGKTITKVANETRSCNYSDERTIHSH